MAAGWTLKDASAYNIQFHEARPIHIDSASFERLEEGSPWIAYRQFCEQFLAPLVLAARRDVRLTDLLRLGPDGIPLDLASRIAAEADMARLRTRSPMCICMPEPRPVTRPTTMTDGRRGRRASHGRAWKGSSGTCARPSRGSTGIRAERNGLTMPSTRATPSARRRTRTAWWTRGCASCRERGYGTSARTPVASAGSRPTRASASSPSTSIQAAAERHFRLIREAGRTDILPLVVDIANPSPALGWAGRERRSLLERANADAILALALVHHLALTRNVPLPMLVDLFADLAPWAIVEFVPKEDPMVRRLLATRRDVFPRYDLDGFRAAAATRFEILREAPIADSPRVLFLLRRS